VVVTRIRNDGVKSCAQTSGLRKVRVNYVKQSLLLPAVPPVPDRRAGFSSEY
jgi:hypothetical protein